MRTYDMEQFSIFRTNNEILTSLIRADPHVRVVGSLVDVVTLRDQMVKVARFSCVFLTALAGNKAGKNIQSSSMYFYVRR